MGASWGPEAASAVHAAAVMGRAGEPGRRHCGLVAAGGGSAPAPEAGPDAAAARRGTCAAAGTGEATVRPGEWSSGTAADGCGRCPDG